MEGQTVVSAMTLPILTWKWRPCEMMMTAALLHGLHPLLQWVVLLYHNDVDDDDDDNIEIDPFS
eukprot:scaffold6898_cov123-Cylindrotheca_fusiformis.AAC.3